jgi:hypothetical protein
MLKSPVLSTPVQRALAGAAATGGAVQSGQNVHGVHFITSEGADQSGTYGNTGLFWYPSEGADQSGNGSTYIFRPSEGADQSTNIFYGHPSEGADQSWTYGVTHAPSEGADQSGHWSGYAYGPSEGADQSGHFTWYPSEG